MNFTSVIVSLFYVFEIPGSMETSWNHMQLEICEIKHEFAVSICGKQTIKHFLPMISTVMVTGQSLHTYFHKDPLE